ncbi:hypothetical protein [Parasedimentitalea huanghaiensis]|uniref:Uncharacterized protein n=1 Tax=Parasedimentitalea huanghaiensis TaxID=2682100 RepID=A0A6L6WBS7_9RHOB|nr:hypothetical protein [Zongyanglinia huanghaiensis]MVO14688.1 hypothetical protein [Zongyanglinia huanghaiensis]
MRAVILTLLILFANAAQTPAQTMPPSTYPEAGTFCGFLKLCPKVTTPKQDD